MKEYHVGQTVIPYEIEWTGDRSTIGLSMDSSMELTVRAPLETTEEDVEEVLAEKQQWLLETLYGLAEQEDPPLDKEFLSGEKLLYRGRRYRLKVHDDAVPEPELAFDGDQFDLTVPEDGVNRARKRQTAVDWYVERASHELPVRVDEYATKLGVDEYRVDVRNLARRWGEYADGRISLHWRLVLAPMRIQDYVVVHELAHSRYDEHSNAFWNAVGSVIPDYEERREWLRVNGSTLTV